MERRAGWIELFLETMLTFDQISPVIGEEQSDKKKGGNHSLTKVYSFKAHG